MRAWPGSVLSRASPHDATTSEPAIKLRRNRQQWIVKRTFT
ncbi:MAG TPA: hypothetical protein VNP04_21850 [Alphaproteobacteria bacterium]|nr:hypothetical protein [Alphaproteobacteria bacterium]